jgi:cold-inducible RNA-binding protein
MAEEYRCFVGGLAWATNDQSLEQAFSQFGEITDCKVTPLFSETDLR